MLLTNQRLQLLNINSDKLQITDLCFFNGLRVGPWRMVCFGTVQSRHRCGGVVSELGHIRFSICTDGDSAPRAGDGVDEVAIGSLDCREVPYGSDA
jgi:hypothetical protein